MNLQEYFNHCGVLKTHGNNASYENIENVVGKQVWVCDYRNSEKGAGLKPIRNIKPTFVQVCANGEKDRVYYSPVHFKEVKANGNLNSKVIAPYDNTGYRCLTGTSLNIFETKEECVTFFNSQLKVAIKDIENEAESYNKHFEYKLSGLKSMIID